MSKPYSLASIPTTKHDNAAMPKLAVMSARNHGFGKLSHVAPVHTALTAAISCKTTYASMQRVNILREG